MALHDLVGNKAAYRSVEESALAALGDKPPAAGAAGAGAEDAKKGAEDAKKGGK